MVTNIVLQAVERNLPQKPRNLLKLVTPPNQKPVRSLESMHILNGNSRFGNSLGVWTPYADGTVDLLPLNPVEKHQLLREDENEFCNLDENIEMDKLKKVANLRFKGSINGKFKSDKFYEDNKPLRNSNQKNKKSRMYDSNLESDSEDDMDKEKTDKLNGYSSIAPIQYSEFIIKELSNNRKEQDDSVSHSGTPEDDGRTSITMKLTGMDVFAGLHELSVYTIDKTSMILDPAKVPNWLTGEEGTSCGIIRDGRFTKNI